MGLASSTGRAAAVEPSVSGVPHARLRDLLRLVGGESAFHRAIRNSHKDGEAQAVLQEQCDLALLHHDTLQRQLLSTTHSFALATPEAWGCCGKSARGGAKSSTEAAPPPQEVLRRVLDLQNRKGQTALHLAAELGFEECVKLLLQQGTSPWVRDRLGRRVALHVACLHGQVACVKQLLDHLPEQWRQSPDDAMLSYLECATLSGFTPLHCAAASGSAACVHAVLAHHPLLDAASALESHEFQLEFPRGSTALHIVAAQGNLDVACELLRYHNSMVLSSQGRLPAPSSMSGAYSLAGMSAFGGRLPTRGSPVPRDPRLVANSAHQLPWQVAQALGSGVVCMLVEMLHPSTPHAGFFLPHAAAHSTLQALAGEALRLKLQHTLDVAQQAKEQHQRLQVKRAQREGREHGNSGHTGGSGWPLTNNHSMLHAARLASGNLSGSRGGGGRKSAPFSLPIAHGVVAEARVLMGASMSDSVAGATGGRLRSALKLRSPSATTATAAAVAAQQHSVGSSAGRQQDCSWSLRMHAGSSGGAADEAQAADLVLAAGRPLEATKQGRKGKQ